MLIVNVIVSLLRQNRINAYAKEALYYNRKTNFQIKVTLTDNKPLYRNCLVQKTFSLSAAVTTTYFNLWEAISHKPNIYSPAEVHHFILRGLSRRGEII